MNSALTYLFNLPFSKYANSTQLSIHPIKLFVLLPYSRPNPFNPTGNSGFGAEGLMNLIGLFTSIAPDFHFERKLTWICNDEIALLSRVTATIKNIEGNVGMSPYMMDKLQ